MAEQRSIVLAALLAAILVAGGVFYFFFRDTAPGALTAQVARETPQLAQENTETMPQGSLAAGSPAPEAMTETTRASQSATGGSVPSPAPAVAGGGQGVTPTAQNRPSDYVALAATAA